MTFVRRLFAVMLVALIVAGCASVPEGTKVETIFLDHVDASGKPIKLEARLYLPPGNGPFDVVLYSHGGHASTNPSAVESYAGIASMFLERRVAFFALHRQGRGGSGGTVSNANCNPAGAIRAYTQDYGDVLIGLQFIKKSPITEGKRVFSVGYSRGGTLSAGLAVREHTAVAKAVSLAPGWLAIWSCPNGQDLHNTLFERLASPSASPTLFLYAENDGHHPSKSNAAAFGRYKAKGGTGTMKTYPAAYTSTGGGHALPEKPEVYREDVLRFFDIR